MNLLNSRPCSSTLAERTHPAWCCYCDLSLIVLWWFTVILQIHFGFFSFVFQKPENVIQKNDKNHPHHPSELSISNIILLSRARVGGRRKLCQRYLKLVKSLSRIRLFSTPWTVAYQAPLSIEFSSQEYWSGLPFPYPGHQPWDRTQVSCTAGRCFTIWATREALIWS